jgi:L-seryl-tRNA(Ser) seleniumtransferase
MRAHRSNFAIIGFTTEPSLSELADLAHQYGVPLIDDLGSGALIDASDFGLKPEPTVQASLAAGADLVMFSGDKLLGGPQAGILAGKAELVAQVRQHPLARAVRPDKLCLAALTTTLMHYLKDEALDRVPVWRMISRSLGEIDAQVRRWADKLASAGLPCELVDSQSVVGGGSLPGETLPTRALAISLKSSDEAARRLREHNPPVIVRREDERLIVDPRTVLPREEDDLLSALLILNQTST